MNPEAIREGLLIQELGEELVIYDQERQIAHRLDATSAHIYRHCDGKTAIKELVTLTGDESLVWAALEALQGAHLLRAPLLGRKVGGGRGMVESLLAPLPAAAYTW